MSTHSDTPGHGRMRLVLPIVVFMAGFTTMGVEMSGARLLAPYFGTSLYVWAVLIGLIMIYLTVGYYVGGRLADAYPRPEALCRVTVLAALAVALIPPLAHPILAWSALGFAQLSAGLFLGSLAAVLLLFSLPVAALGTVSPFAVRLSVQDVGHAGNAAGSMYAISSCGSLAGTFVTVFGLIPTIGTRRTLLVLSVTLMVVSLLGLWRRSPLYLSLLLVPLLQLAVPAGSVRAAESGRLLYETESAYYYIQVVQDGGKRELVLDEGHAVHSVYDPRHLLTGEYWDYFLAAPLFTRHYSPAAVRRIAVVGLGGGTAARLYSTAYPAARIDGIEIDPAVVAVARRYFDLHEPHLYVATADGRYFLLTHPARYDVVAIDAFRQPYIPFQLTTREFFALVRDHLSPHGVVAVNAGHTATDFRLVDALAHTLRSVYPSVYVMDVPGTINSVIVASMDRVPLPAVQRNAAAARGITAAVGRRMLRDGRLRQGSARGTLFTDDLAPVEQLIDQIVVHYVTSGQ